MVKKGGTKRKMAIKKIMMKSSLGPICTKRRYGLFSKASQTCLLSGGQIAILTTPLSSESNVTFYSFGNSSAYGLVSAFLSGQRPVPNDENSKEMREDVGVCLTRKNLGLGFWWHDNSLTRSENPREVSDAINSMWMLLSNLKKLRSENAFVYDHEYLMNNEESDVVLDHANQYPGQSLNLQSGTSAICYVPGDLPEQITEEQDQILAICDSFCGSNNNTLTEVILHYGQEIDIDQLIDFETPFERSLDAWFSDNTPHQEQQETTASLLTNSEVVYDHVWRTQI